MKKREDHRIQEQEQQKAQAQERKLAKEQRKLMERLGTMYCVFCKKVPATTSTSPGILEANACEPCARQHTWKQVQAKYDIVPVVPTVKTNIGDKLIAALNKK